MEFKNIVKEMIQNYFVIITGTFLGTLIYCLIFSRDSVFTLEYLAAMFVFGLLGDLPLVIFCSDHELSRKEWRVRQSIHFLLVETVLLGAAWYMELYHTLFQGIIFAVIVLGVYVLVAIFSWKRDQSEADQMNQRLSRLRESRE